MGLRLSFETNAWGTTTFTATPLQFYVTVPMNVLYIFLGSMYILRFLYGNKIEMMNYGLKMKK
jgi:hypothetical protein